MIWMLVSAELSTNNPSIILATERWSILYEVNVNMKDIIQLLVMGIVHLATRYGLYVLGVVAVLLFVASLTRYPI